ncbi:unnamed protein product [Clavelina lepadiformis]|uniref:Cytochrome b561 domain-containing protein n=1 Tax=Clavelina lepadiformis TaxID=159417 RepID=A0ABP0FR85_CLALP
MATSEAKSRTAFWIFFGFFQILGIFSIVIFVVWECFFNKGFAWDYRNRQFAIHPLVMVLSMVVLYGQGSLTYRVVTCMNRSKVKILHLVIMGTALVLAVFGVVTVFIYHHHMNYGDMYTLHSWCGMMTVASFALQFFLGMGILLFKGVDGNLKRSYLSLHRYGSLAILAMVGASVVSGVIDDVYLCMSNKSYRDLKLHAVVLNVMGLTSLIAVLNLMYLLYRDDWKRNASNRSGSPEGDVPAQETRPRAPSNDDNFPPPPDYPPPPKETTSLLRHQ